MSQEASQSANALGDGWEALRRRRRPAIWVGLLVIISAGAAAIFWPATYRSTGTILIEQQELPQDLVMSTITSFADQRIQVISQRVMTTDNLLHIIQHYDLYPKLRRNEPREVLLDHMRSDIHFDMISADVMDPRQGRATKANIAFAVSYDSVSPELSARVANELVSLYLDENVKSRRQQTADAATFLEVEATRLSREIDELQANLAVFKDKHINTLPEQALYNNQLLTRSEEELRDTETQLRSLDQQATYLDAQLAQISPSSQVYTSTGERVLSPNDRLKFLRTEYARLTGIYGPDHPDVVRTRNEIESLEHSVGRVDTGNDLSRQLQDARTHLAALQKQYAPDHPDVQKLQRLVDALALDVRANAPSAAASSAAMTAAPSAADGSTAGAGIAAGTLDGNPDNPAFIQIKAQREATDAERTSLRQKQAELQERIGKLEGRLAASPSVERDYSELARELDNDQLKYRDVRQKQMSAKLAETLEDQQKGERFTLIDPPLVPERPASPNRWLLGGMGSVLALMAAVGSVVLLEQVDPSVRNRRDLEALLQVPPLAVLPVFTSSADRALHRRRRRYVWAAAVGACFAALALTHLLYRPLDVLWEVARRKLGV